MAEHKFKTTMFPIDSDSNKVIILTPDYIIDEINQDEAEQFIENMNGDENFFDSLNLNKVYNINTIVRISSNQKTHIITLKTKANGKKETDFLAIESKEHKEQFLHEIYHYLKDECSFRVKEYNRLTAAFRPLLMLLIIIGLGTFLTWFAFEAQQGLDRTRVVKASVYYLYKTMAYIGPTGAMIISGVALLIGMAMLAYRVKNPPIMTFIKRNI
ncbi:hypothetical protein [Paenibacillus glacialis]|uniref:Uncharacterized protein n=1 Tax=Paenibacillus glacialis TaxID=494026 RepID=A0A168NX16_9BACL|nr:hypothetical protein [Paenibacillus glacialis]OAB46177.1 hypothetical protein PGLA_01980 [Paenibacillus glacialis]